MRKLLIAAALALIPTLCAAQQAAPAPRPQTYTITMTLTPAQLEAIWQALNNANPLLGAMQLIQRQVAEQDAAAAKPAEEPKK